MNETNKLMATQIFEWLDFTVDIIEILQFIGDLRELVDAILQAFGGNFTPLADWVEAFVADPWPGFEWLSGLGDWSSLDTIFAPFSAIGDAVEGVQGIILNVINAIMSAIRKVPVVGGEIADRIGEMKTDVGGVADTAQEASQQAESISNQVHYVREVISLRAGRSVWETGPDRTGTVSFPFGLLNIMGGSFTTSSESHTHTINGSTANATAGGTSHSHSNGGLNNTSNSHSHTGTVGGSVPTVNVTATYAPWGNLIFDSNAERRVLTFIGMRTGTVTSFNLDLYKMEEDGSSTLVYSSPDLAPGLGATLQWQQHLLPNKVLTDIGDIYDVQFRMVGSGTVTVAGVNMPYPTPIPGLRPYSSGSARNPSSSPAPTTISTATRDSMYVGPTPWISFGIDVGQTAIPRYFYDDLNRTSWGSSWVIAQDMGLSSGRAYHPGGFLTGGDGRSIWQQQTLTDTVESTFTITTANSGFMGVGICLNSSGTAGAWVMVNNEETNLCTGSYEIANRTERSTAPIGGAGSYKVRYTAVDNTYRVYKDGSTTPIISWVDSSNVVTHGLGRRWVGIIAAKGSFQDSSYLDNWSAYDYSAA
ncbi:minor tail protein [Gordonia Phage JonJames]|nr:minor tail protein [Gordonia Phage JonJames]